MTQNRRAKRAIRAQMAQSGEKYTEARRSLPRSGGGAGDGVPPGVVSAMPDDPLASFTDQAYNVILLAEDEARMLGRATVEPEHLLLALARSGNAQRLLAERAGVEARAIHDAVVRFSGFGDELVGGTLPRSPASEAALGDAVTEAAARGSLGPSSEHLLLALAGHESVSRVLAELGVADVRAIVDAAHPLRRPPLDAAAVELRARGQAGRVRRPPRPGPIPPLFERFTIEAHQALAAGVRRARVLDDPYVELAHLLHGLLEPGGGVVAGVCARHGWQLEPAVASERDEERHRRATGIFTAAARRIVAEGALEVAGRFGHRGLGTGHLLLAILERPDESTEELAGSLPRQLAVEVERALPGDERA